MSAPSVPNIELRPWPEAGAITFYWLPPSSDGGSPILNYTLACTAIAYSQDLSANTPFYKVTGLTNGIEYTFTLTATNAIGTSPAATFRSVQPGGIPFGPTQAIASTINTSTALVTWNNPSTIANEGASKWFVIMTQPGSNVVPSTYKAAYIYERARTFQLTSTAIAYRFLVQSINDTGYCTPFAFTSSIFGTTPFSPSSIAGMQLWLDASDPLYYTLSGTTVTSFRDKSGLSNSPTTIQGSPQLSNNAIGENSAIRLNGGSTWMQGPYINTASNLTAFNVATMDAGDSVRRLLAVGRSGLNDYDNVSSGILCIATGTSFSAWRTSQTLATVSVNIASSFLQSIVFNGTSVTNYRDGGAAFATSGTSGNFNTALYTIGREIGANSYWAGYLGETMIFNRTFTTFERQQVEGYLAWKWGLQSNLPVVHPFRSSAPVANDSTFYPTQILGVQAWYDAADPLATGTAPTNGTTISTFFDKSGFGRNATGGTPVLSTNSLNNQPTVLFSNGNGYTIPYTSFPTSYSIFTLYRQNASASYMGFLGGGTHVYFYIGAGGSGSTLQTMVGNPPSWNDLNQNTPGVSLLNNYTLISLTNNNTTLSPFTNGSAQNTKVGTTGSFNNFVFGRALPASGVNGFSGNFAEMLIYTGTLDQYSRQQVEGYMAWKWGLQSTLYVGHPFRYTPPVNSTIGFLPTMASNLQGWYDGADPAGTGSAPTNGSTITTWVDKSPFARHATAGTGAVYSTTEGGFLRFSGATGYPIQSTANAIVNNYYTVFITEKTQINSQNYFVGGSGLTTNTNLIVGYLNGASSMIMAQYFNDLTTPAVTPYSTAASQPIRIWTFSQRASNRSISLNGSTIRSDTNNALLSSWATANIGYRQEAGLYYNGNLYDVLFYTGQMSTFTQQQVEGYLAWKWNLQSNLPLYHPFRGAAPTTAPIAFSPIMLNGLQVWLDAADNTAFTLSGSNVTQWRDKSGLNNHFGVLQGSPLLLFDSTISTVRIPSSTVMECANTINITTNHTVLAVTKVNGLPTTSYIGHFMASPSAASGAIRYSSDTFTLNDVQLRGGPSKGTDSSDWMNTINVNGSRNATTTSTFLNYHMFDGQVTIAPGNAKPCISGTFQSRFYIGNVSEILIFSSTLSTADRNALQGYLAWKWGLQTLLPSTHPYRSAAPTSSNV